MALTRVALDEEDTRALQIASQEDKNEDKGPAITQVSTSGAVVGRDEHGDDSTGESS